MNSHQIIYVFKLRFFSELALFIIYYAFCLSCIIMKRSLYTNYLKQASTSPGVNISISSGILPNKSLECMYSYSHEDASISTRITIEIILVIYTLLFVAFKLNELRIQKLKLYLWILANDLPKVFFIIGLVCELLVIPMRLLCLTEAEDYLSAVSILFMSFNFFYFFRGFRKLANFFYIFHRILTRDLSRFFLIYSIFLIGFSQGKNLY